jgi:hypothetical protein
LTTLPFQLHEVVIHCVPTPSRHPTLFLNARLIDGGGGEPVENAAVRVEGTGSRTSA